jgi:hypothetical protein
MPNFASSWSVGFLAQSSSVPSARLGRTIRYLVPGLLALLAAVPLGFLIARVNTAWPNQPEKATQIVGIVFAGLLVLPPAIYLGVRRRAATFSTLALIILASVGVLLVACYLYSLIFDILFPADILIWSESEFINDILKFRLGYPIYTAQANNESFIYLPGAQLLTYGLAWLSGHARSLVAYRVIQVGYSLLAAIIAVSCTRQLLDSNSDSRRLKNQLLWGAISLPLLFLIATNSLTNPFTHLLHNDALAQLVTIAAYFLLLRYAITRDKRLLWLMAIIPAAGFWVKQPLAIWAVFYCFQLAVFDRPRSIKRLLVFGLAAFGGISVSMAVGYVLWGGDFTYWIFTVMGKHDLSPLRSFRHALDVWPYIAIGLLGGAVLLRGDNFRRLLGPWLVWLILIFSEIYTSGVAWMLNHIGPGCLIAGVWFVAALIVVWPRISEATVSRFKAQEWLRAGIGLAILLLMLSGLNIVRVPARSVDDDAYRYVGEIEREFQGHPADKVLLDMGTWIYARDGVVMKDRATNIGDRGLAQIGDFSGIIQRLQEKHYAKILVRNFHSPDFWYDHEMWDKPSGIRQAMMDNYREIGKIEPVGGPKAKSVGYGFAEISILVPRAK